MVYGAAIDWTNPVPYAAIAPRGRSALAWEVLRRIPAYATARDTADWGLHFR